MRDLYYRKLSIGDAEAKQEKFDAITSVLNIYTPKGDKYIKAKDKLLNNVKKIYEERKLIIEGFKKIFLIHYNEEQRFRGKIEEDENGLIDYNRLARLIDLEKRVNWWINDELVKKHFQVPDLEILLKRLKQSKNNLEKNKVQVSWSIVD